MHRSQQSADCRARENRHGDAGITGKVVMISALTCLYTILYISEDKASWHPSRVEGTKFLLMMKPGEDRGCRGPLRSEDPEDGALQQQRKKVSARLQFCIIEWSYLYLKRNIMQMLSRV